MRETQIIEEVKRYLQDNTYQYAILIDGEWGCGKTFFVNNALSAAIDEFEAAKEKSRSIKYISLYGCKTVQDIQDAVICSFADELSKKVSKNENKDELRSNALSTFMKLLSGAKERFLPTINLSDLISTWLIRDYIFIFDDLERCACPINETFGYINRFVEHEQTKVILVSNEQEITEKEPEANRELQLLLALDDRIDWSTADNPLQYTRHNPPRKMKADNLENRRQFLFPSQKGDESYKKIREKIIGVTLHYQPDIQTTCVEIIRGAISDKSFAELLIENLETYYYYMDRYEHHNLRTFQFFLSKASYLYTMFDKIQIDSNHKKQVLTFITEDCFVWAIEFKSNYHIRGNSLLEQIRYDTRVKLLTIKNYVEYGEFVFQEFQNEIQKYVFEQITNKISDDDPFQLLYNGLFSHSQQWCEDNLEKIKENLIKNVYPWFAYQKMIVLLQKLTDLGFDASYFNSFKSIMLANIDQAQSVEKISEDLFYLESGDFKNKVLTSLHELNSAITKKINKTKESSIEEILNDSSWASELDDFIADNNLLSDPYFLLFCAQPDAKWVSAITQSTPEEINIFRHVLNNVLPKNKSRRIESYDDLSVIAKIRESIKPEDVTDLIVRVNLQWLNEQIDETLMAYQKEMNPVSE